VEVAGDLYGEGAVVERLRQLAVGDLAAADEDDGAHQPGRGAENRKRGAGVAGAGAGGAFGAGDAGVRERRGHAVVLEAAAGVHALVLQEQMSRLQADVARYRVRLLKNGLAFTDGQHLVGGREGQQLAETPDAAEAERVGAVGPFRLELAQRPR